MHDDASSDDFCDSEAIGEEGLPCIAVAVKYWHEVAAMVGMGMVIRIIMIPCHIEIIFGILRAVAVFVDVESQKVILVLPGHNGKAMELRINEDPEWHLIELNHPVQIRM